MSEICFDEINEQTKINVPKKQYVNTDMSKISTYGSFQEDVLSKIHVVDTMPRKIIVMMIVQIIVISNKSIILNAFTHI